MYTHIIGDEPSAFNYTLNDQPTKKLTSVEVDLHSISLASQGQLLVVGAALTQPICACVDILAKDLINVNFIQLVVDVVGQDGKAVRLGQESRDHAEHDPVVEGSDWRRFHFNVCLWPNFFFGEAGDHVLRYTVVINDRMRNYYDCTSVEIRYPVLP